MDGERTNQNSKAVAYWKANLKAITILLTIWALVSYGGAILLAEPLFNLRFGQIPLSFWFAQQGSMITFVILIFVYSWWMNKIDREYDVHEE